MSESSGATPRYKVGKVIERYGLDGIGEDLEAHWLGDGVDAYSLRDLAEYFNKAVLESALEESDRQQFGGEVETLYRLLTDDVSSGDRTRAEKSLERNGIDVEALRSDFVTHQAIHTYLRKGRGVEKDADSGDPLESARETVNRLRSRLTAVTETSLSTLRDRGTISLGSFDVFVEVSVHCTDCGTHRSLGDLLAQGGCDCETDG